MKSNSLIFLKYIIPIIILFSSCKSELEKISLNDLEAQKNYQNKIIDTSKTSIAKFNSIKLLIKEYKKIEEKNPRNPNLDFLIGRLYVLGANLPFYEVFFDLKKSDFNDQLIYEKFVDSSYYYNMHALDLDKDHINSMNNLCSILQIDFVNNNKSFQKSYIFKRNPTLFNNVINYIVNNSERFISPYGQNWKKDMSDFITEMSFYLLTVTIDDDKIKELNLNDQNFQIKLKKIEKCINYFDKGIEFKIVEKKFYNLAKDFYVPLISQVNRVVEDAQIESHFNDIDIKHKYSYVNSEAGVFGMLELYTNSDYTQGVGPYGATQSGFMHGRGSYSRNGHKITFYSSSGISMTGDARLELVNNKLIIILTTGAVYVQDDQGYYIKNIISTKDWGENLSSSNNNNLNSKCSDMDSYSFGNSLAADQIGGGLVADCEYLFSIAQTQKATVNHDCFCKGVNDWIKDHK